MRYFFINDIRKLNKLNYPRMVDRFVALAASKAEELPHKIPYPSLVIDRKNIDTFSSRYAPILFDFVEKHYTFHSEFKHWTFYKLK